MCSISLYNYVSSVLFTYSYIARHKTLIATLNRHKSMNAHCLHCSVERYYGTVIIINYQLQIPLYFSNTVKTKPCKYRMNLLTQVTIMFLLFICDLLCNVMASPLSVETNTLNVVNSLDLSEYHSVTEVDEQGEETTDCVQQGMQLISKMNTKSLIWKSFGFTTDKDGRPTNYCNLKCKLSSKDVSDRFGNTSNLLKLLHMHHRNK